MMNRKFSINFLVTAFSCFAHADSSEEFIVKYLDKFSRMSDLSAFFVDKPQFIFGPHTLTPESPSEASNFILGIRSKLAELNYGKSHIDKAEVRAEIDSYSLITFSITRLEIDGSVLDKVCSTYGVLNTENGYKIISWQPSKVGINGTC